MSPVRSKNLKNSAGLRASRTSNGMSKEDLIQEIIENLSRLHRPVDGDAWRRLGLSHAQVGMLYMISCHDQPSYKQVANHLGVTQSAISQLIDPLLDKGLVKRHIDPKDRRISRLSLTAKGSTCLKKLRRLKTAGLRTALAGLPSSNLQDLHQIVNKLSIKRDK